MKKSIIMAICAIAATPAMSQVSVYGRLDAGYTDYTVFSGNTRTNVNGVQSHNAASSFWGVTGAEDLGGGLKAIFNLEQDVYVANGATGNSGSGNGAVNSSGFNRLSNLGLSGGLGTITVGRNVSPIFRMISSSTPFGAVRFDSTNLGSTGGGAAYYGNSVAYTTPNISGVTVSMLLVNNDQSTTTTDEKTNVQQLTTVYTSGNLMVGGGVGGGTSVKGAVGSFENRNTGSALVASYNFGSFRLLGNMLTREQITANSKVKDEEVNLAIAVPAGKFTYLAQLGTNARTNNVGGNSTGQDYAIGVDYSLSRKTIMYVRNGENAKLNSSANILEQRNTGTSIGMRTVF